MTVGKRLFYARPISSELYPVLVTDALGRFKTAQADPLSGFTTALRELLAGQKRSHWIWYIFPQLAGLGSSPMAATYGLRDIGEAMAYLRDPLLRERLLAVTQAVTGHLQPGLVERQGNPVLLSHVMGSEVDARKLVSSMTLFAELAKRLNATDARDDYTALAADAGAILHAAAAQGLPPCTFTRRVLERHPAG